MIKSQNKDIDNLFLYFLVALLLIFIIILIFRLPLGQTKETFINPNSNIKDIATSENYKSNGNMLVINNDLSNKLKADDIIIVNNIDFPNDHYQYIIDSIKTNSDNETIITLNKPSDLPLTGKLSLYLLENNIVCGLNTLQCYNNNNEEKPGLCYDLKSRNTVSSICNIETDNCMTPDYSYNGIPYYLRSNGLDKSCILEDMKNNEEDKTDYIQKQHVKYPKATITQESAYPVDMKNFYFEKNKSTKDGSSEEVIFDIKENMDGQSVENKDKLNIKPTSTVSRKMDIDSMNMPSQIILNIGYNNKSELNSKENMDKKLNDEQQPSTLPYTMDSGFSGDFKKSDDGTDISTQNKPYQNNNSLVLDDNQDVLPGLDLTPLASFDPID